MALIRPMTTADLQLGLRLTRQAGWNQTESDWRRFLDLEPQGCFVAEWDGRAVGTTTTCIFDSVAWIAMVLVDVDARRKGVGTALLKHALDFLDTSGIRTVRLDATAAGQRVYEKLGFVPEYSLTRYEGTASQAGTRSHIVPATPAMFAQMTAFDRRMTGTARAKMLTRLFEEFPQAVRVLCRGDELEGYITMRPGANAMQIGPCISTPQAGPALLGDALDRCAGRSVFLDVLCDNVRAVRFVEARGLQIQRLFTRMCRGDRVEDEVEALWASSGPEKG